MTWGYVFAIIAYCIWGLAPIFWHQLDAVPALDLTAHRVFWGLLFLLLWRGFKKQNLSWKLLTQTPQVWLSATLLFANWLTFVWAIQHERIVEASLGYFINPLLSVVMGVLFLKEALRPIQWFSVSLAAVGFFYIAADYGSIPWVALSLAITFGGYGLIQKMSPIKAFDSLSYEASLMTPLALIYLLVKGDFVPVAASEDPLQFFLLPFTGIITITPLLFFGVSARRIPLSHLGLLQYIGPSLSFLVGWLLYQEPVSADRWWGFSLIWIALLFFATEKLYQQRVVKLAL